MKYTPQTGLQLHAGTGFTRPPELPRIIHLDDPAREVMTDFHHVHPVTVAPATPIDAALERMKAAGVRLLLVTDETDRIVGLITSHDIQGEKPIELMQDQRIRRSQISVAMIMVTPPGVDALELAQVEKLQVGHIVATLEKLERQHMLVVETDPDTGRQQVCGLFSMSQINKQLSAGQPVTPYQHRPTVAELVHELRT